MMHFYRDIPFMCKVHLSSHALSSHFYRTRLLKKLQSKKPLFSKQQWQSTAGDGVSCLKCGISMLVQRVQASRHRSIQQHIIDESGLRNSQRESRIYFDKRTFVTKLRNFDESHTHTIPSQSLWGMMECVSGSLGVYVCVPLHFGLAVSFATYVFPSFHVTLGLRDFAQSMSCCSFTCIYSHFWAEAMCRLR